jgi:hypothetical protein
MDFNQLTQPNFCEQNSVYFVPNKYEKQFKKKLIKQTDKWAHQNADIGSG